MQNFGDGNSQLRIVVFRYLHTHLYVYLHATPTRRTEGLSMGNFETYVLSQIGKDG
jgi:hypothetical protein